MKYLLILLFLFSTHSFSGEIDGKGIDCNMLSVDDEKYQEMFVCYKGKTEWKQKPVKESGM